VPKRAGKPPAGVPRQGVLLLSSRRSPFSNAGINTSNDLWAKFQPFVYILPNICVGLKPYYKLWAKAQLQTLGLKPYYKLWAKAQLQTIFFKETREGGFRLYSRDFNRQEL
jgi:hypothetical protein